MTLAASLLEGYGYNGVAPSDNTTIVDPILYLQEACIEAVNALYEASQQYYIADIIGQVEVVREGMTNEALMESAGEKLKQIWEAFKRKVKEIIDKIISKIRKVIQWIKAKLNKTDTDIKKCKKELQAAEREMSKRTNTKTENPEGKFELGIVMDLPKVCVDAHNTSYKLMIQALPKISDLVTQIEEDYGDEEYINELTKSLAVGIVNNTPPEDTYTTHNISFTDLSGNEISIDQLIDLLDDIFNHIDKNIHNGAQEVSIEFDETHNILDRCEDIKKESEKCLTQVTSLSDKLRKLDKYLDNNGYNHIKNMIAEQGENNLPPEDFLILILRGIHLAIFNMSTIMNNCIRAINLGVQNTEYVASLIAVNLTR